MLSTNCVVFSSEILSRIGAENSMTMSHTKISKRDPEASPFPLIELREHGGDGECDAEIPHKVVSALKSSGFLLITSPSVSKELQEKVLQTARDIFALHANSPLSIGTKGTNENNSDTKIITHPTDPKLYVMLESRDDITTWNSVSKPQRDILSEYWTALEQVKKQVLKCIAIGLGLPSSNYFVDLHEQNNSALRLLSYPPMQESTSSSVSTTKLEPKDMPTETMIRCKPHSDYGSITLLLTDGAPGLQALIDDKWTMVPHVPGALVVNIGSLLGDWTNGELLATLHRVVFVEKDGGTTRPRISLAFFADPDKNVATNLRLSKQDNRFDEKVTKVNNTATMNVAEYIQWRSGGIPGDKKRSGVAYTNGEEARAQQARMKKLKVE